MARDLTGFGLRPAVLQLAEVVEVFPDTWTMSTRTLIGARTFKDMSIPSLYMHRFDGEGAHIMPEVGALCLVAVISEKNARAVALCYLPHPGEQGTNRGNRPTMAPGDVVLSTRDGNAVRVRRGGVVEVEATPTCRTVYLPIRGKILHIAETYEMHALGGSLVWATGDPDESPTKDNTKATLALKVKDFAEDSVTATDLLMGGGDGAELSVFQGGAVSSESLRQLATRVAMTQGGDVEISASGTVTIHGTGIADAGMVEKVILGETFLTDLMTMLTALQAGLSSFGIVVPDIGTMIGKITSSLAAGTPYLSNKTKTQ